MAHHEEGGEEPAAASDEQRGLRPFEVARQVAADGVADVEDDEGERRKEVLPHAARVVDREERRRERGEDGDGDGVDHRQRRRPPPDHREDRRLRLALPPARAWAHERGLPPEHGHVRSARLDGRRRVVAPAPVPLAVVKLGGLARHRLLGVPPRDPLARACEGQPLDREEADEAAAEHADGTANTGPNNSSLNNRFLLSTPVTTVASMNAPSPSMMLPPQTILPPIASPADNFSMTSSR